jgi:hypothetical protein
MERALGHPLMTLTDVYEATWERKYAAGAARMVDWAAKWEDPVRGGFPAPITERPAFSAGSPFCSGLLFSALMKFNSWARLPAVDAMLERTARHLLTDMWRPPNGILFKGASGAHSAPGDITTHLRLMPLMHARTGDPLFLAVPREMMLAGYGAAQSQFGTRSTGLVFNYLPWFLAALAEAGDPTPEPGLSVTAAPPALAMAAGTAARACFVVKNSGAGEITELRASFQPRLDFVARRLAPLPASLQPGRQAEDCYEVRAPAGINLTYEANRVAYGHWSAGYRRAGKPHLGHAWLKIEVAPP